MVLFYRRRYSPKLLPAVQTTVVGLIDLDADQLPFSELETLANSLTLLPRREELHPAFEKFLSEIVFQNMKCISALRQRI